MNILPIAAFVVTMLSAALPLSQPASARTGIQRCESADGSAAYTDRACASLGAQAMPMSGELLTRIARDEAANLLPDDSDGAPVISSAGRRSLSGGCARTTTQLSMDLQGSLALHDVNRLAESYHWVGQSNRQAQQLMQRLGRLSTQPLLEAHFFDAQIGLGGVQLADASNGNRGNGIMQLAFGRASAPQVIDFDVLRYAGCYFIRF